MRRNLGISTVFPKYHPRAGEPTGFEAAILNHQKLHTIRAGNRWTAGDTARVFTWTGEPYRSKQRVIIPDLQTVKVYDIEIDKPYSEPYAINGVVYINNVFYGEFDNIEMRMLAENDGLAVQDFLDWFGPHIPFYGQIICWNDVKY